jgi:hypothetical protein
MYVDEQKATETGKIRASNCAYTNRECKRRSVLLNYSLRSDLFPPSIHVVLIVVYMWTKNHDKNNGADEVYRVWV